MYLFYIYIYVCIYICMYVCIYKLGTSYTYTLHSLYKWIQTLACIIKIPHALYIHIHIFRAPLVTQRSKRLPAMWETRVRSLSREDPLEKEMATHSSIIAWRIPWREDPGRLQSMGSQRVGHDWATSLSLSFLSTWIQSSSFPCPEGVLSICCFHRH